MLHILLYIPLLSRINAQSRNRTSDTRIFSPLLYQLSYLGKKKLRGQDLNLRPSGYEPDELPDCSTPRYYLINYTHILIKYANNVENFFSKMDGGGFEPPKALLTDLQSAPFGHSGTHPKSR